MASNALSVAEILALLESTPRRIVESTDGLSREQLHQPPQPGEWSLNDILAHLRSCADVWGGCITAIAVQKVDSLRAMNPRTWIRQTNYPVLEFGPSLQAFLAQRADLLRLLASFTPEDWTRTATVSGAGKRLVRDARFYAQWLGEHERSHEKHIRRITALMREAGTN